MSGPAESHLFYQSRRRRPLIDQARGVYIWDVEGKRYLDGSSGAMVCNIGHSNPKVLEAMRRQMEKSTFGYRLHFENEPAERLAARVSQLAPDGMNKVFFVSGGSEAVESSIKLARQYALATGERSRWKVISRMPSYHGATLGALALTGYEPMTEPFAPMMKAMPKIRAPLAYLDGLALDDPATGQHYAALLEQAIVEEGPETVLAFIVEPVGGAATGALVPPAGYMEAVAEICKRHGVLLILDEVMTGGGRTGRFFAAEHWHLEPDILALSKGFAAGYSPLGAILAQDHIVDTVLASGGFVHGHTYAGNPLACAAGLAVIDEIHNQDLIANAARMGDLLKDRLRDLMHRFPIIGDVRGKGLLLAFELVADQATMAPLPRELAVFERLVEIAYDKGLIIYSRRTRNGHEGEHFMVCPPMVVTELHVEEIISVLDAALCDLMDEIAPALRKSA